MQADLIQHNNDDLSVANVARTSFHKWNDTFSYDRDTPLINYLAKHKHISPFFHQRFTFYIECQTWVRYLTNASLSDLMGFVWHPTHNHFIVRASFYGWVNFLHHTYVDYVQQALAEAMPASCAAYGIPVNHTLFNYSHPTPTPSLLPKFTDASIRLTIPIFVARQLFTHRMFATNEVSRRYVSTPPEFHEPSTWRSKPQGSIKQGSSGTHPKNTIIQHNYNTFLYGSAYSDGVIDYYNELIKGDVAPEQVRMVLPQSMLTTVIFTGSLHDWAKVYHLRTDSHAQQEVAEILHLVDAQLTKAYPDLWSTAKSTTKD